MKQNILLLATMSTTENQSFGEYFDAQRDRLRKMLDNKDAKQYIEWMEEYEKRKRAGQVGIPEKS